MYFKWHGVSDSCSTCPSRGNSILIGSLGQQLTSLASFALFLAGYDMQRVDFSKEEAFNDGMKAVLRQAGLEGKPVGLVIQVVMCNNA